MRIILAGEGAIARKHVAALRRYARALLGGSTAEADDLVQECLARALAGAHLWRPVKNMRAYLFTILHNVFTDGLTRRHRAVDVAPLDGVPQPTSPPAWMRPGPLRLAPSRFRH
jgi:DNA-directed RNA polymerase specialized sigma24 family protein